MLTQRRKTMDKASKIIRLKRKMIVSRRSILRDFEMFRQYYFPHYNKLPDAEFHTEMVQLLSKITTERGQKCAIAAPRGSAKSTIINLQYIIYCICYKIDEFIVTISNTSDQATGFLTNIKQELESNLRLIQDFPDICEIDRKPGPPRWTQKEIITRNGVKVLALSPGQQIRGRRNKEHRPSLIILDDVEADESLQTPENFYKLHDWLTKSVLKVGTATTNIVYIGTIHHYSSLLAQFTSTDSHSGWYKRVYRSVISWSSHPELWEEWVKIYNHFESHEDEHGPESAKRFFEANKEAMLEGTKVFWEASKSYYDLMVMREQDGPVSFDSEMQNEPVNPRDCHFNLEEIHYWDDKFKDEDELMRSIPDYNRMIFGACDPSMGKHRGHGDYSAILTGVVDIGNKTMYVLTADIERRLPSKTIDDILSHHERYNFFKFGFESNQFQEYMADRLAEKSQEQGNFLDVIQIAHSTYKVARIEALQPMVKNGMIKFSRRHTTLLEQMKYFPKGQHDDGLDALEMLVKLCKDHQGISDAWIG
jgi:predicted phage terminase large subunit-like protein